MAYTGVFWLFIGRVRLNTPIPSMPRASDLKNSIEDKRNAREVYCRLCRHLLHLCLHYRDATHALRRFERSGSTKNRLIARANRQQESLAATTDKEPSPSEGNYPT